MTTPHQASLRRAAITLAAALAAAIGFTVWIENRTTVPAVIVTGDAAIDGRFRLIDQRGRSVSERDFAGKTRIIYFGWLLDEDLTPAALQVLDAALRNLGPKSESMAPIFISLDPERDTPSKIADFLDKSGISITGLVGSEADTVALAKAFRLYFKRLVDPALPGGYSIDHSSLYYVFGVDGEFRSIVPHTTDVQALSAELRRHTK